MTIKQIKVIKLIADFLLIIGLSLISPFSSMKIGFAYKFTVGILAVGYSGKLREKLPKQKMIGNVFLPPKYKILEITVEILVCLLLGYLLSIIQ